MIAGLARFLSISAIVFAARILGAGIAVLIQALLARVLGPEALGVFYVATSAVAVLAVVVAAGYPNLMVRFVARYRERGRPGLIAAFLRRSQIDMLALALAAMVGLMVFALCHPAAEPEIGIALICAAPAIPALAMMRINGSFAVAVRHFTQSWILDLVGRPLLLLAALGGMVMVGTQFSVVLVVLLSTLITIAIAAVQYAWVRPHIPAAPVRDVRLRAAWRSASGPLIAASLFAALFADFDLIVLAGFLSPAELAVIGVCLKLAFLIDFAVYMVQQFATPDIAEGYARADGHLIRTASAQANLAATLTTAGAFIGVLVLGKEILELFRPGFAVGSEALVILAGAQVLRSVFGPSLGLMTVVGAERQISISFVLAVGVLVIANVVLVPAFGLVGAAVAVLVTTLFWTATLAVLLYRRTGLRVDAAASLAAFLHGAPVPASRLARSLAPEVPRAGSTS